MATSFQEKNLQTLLEKIAQDEGFENPKFNIVSATNPGDNFVGQVVRVEIEEAAENKKYLSLIFKLSSPNKARNEIMSSDLLFRNEADVYETILPTLNDFLKKHGISNTPIFPGTPRCYSAALNHSSNGGHVIVLEDKTVDGYSIGSIKTGLDAVQCRLALQKLALLHSSYLALREQEPETADRLSRILNNSLWKNEDDPMVQDFLKGYRNGLDLLGEPYKKGNPVYEKLYKLYENFSVEFMKLCEIPNDVPCVIHGDYWTNNILFKVNQDRVAYDACMLDFQITSLKSPVVDTSCLLLICTTKEVRDQHYDELNQFYYNEVTKTLLACGCDPEKVFPWTKFMEHVKFYSKIGVIWAIGSLEVLLADKSEIKGDIHSEDTTIGIFSDTAKINDPKTLEELTERLNGIVEDAERWGYI